MKTINQLAALLCSAALAVTAIPSVSSGNAVFAADTVSFTVADGWFETAYAEWEPVSGATGYQVYADGKQIDSILIRQYRSFYRVDIPGLKAGSHTVKVVPLISGKEDASKAKEQQVTVKAHDRTGFGWVNGSSSGAYNDDGTLKTGAVVLYVTEETKNTVSLDVVTDSKGTKTKQTGIQNILTAYQKGTDSRPLCIRCIGNITDPAVLMDGDLLIKGSGASKRLSCGVTIEGIGRDTVFNGFGLRIANCSGVEIRNIGFMNCNSGEGDDVGLQQNNDHVWVHNCDMFYGDAGSDADQAKGDGALDTKTSSYITHTYNHFWDNGKCNLQGMKSESTENYITYHHNWYDHSDSRHPRIRTCTVHIYNNYFDGNAKYGVGVTMGASAFVDSNYFRNCPKPMMSSMQGTDAQGDGTFSGETGGIIKAYNNIMVDAKSYITYQDNNQSFDAYEAGNAKDTVPASVKTLSGGTAYNNFDTSAIMYSYKADAPADVPAIVTAGAGRVQGGDFKWQFNNAVDDASYSVNTALKSALVNYKSEIVAIGSGSYVAPTEPAETEPAQPAVTTAPQPEITAAPQVTTAAPFIQILPASEFNHNFTENGLSSNFYQISGNLSTSKGTASYRGMTLTQCLKMESATSIGFNAPADGVMTLVFGEAAGSVKLDGQKHIASDGILTLQISAGAHSLTKADSCNLFYMALACMIEPQQTEQPAETTLPAQAETTVQPQTTTVPETTVSETKPVISALAGDVDESGEVDVSDAVILARFATGDPSVRITDNGLVNADCDGIAGLNSFDVIHILRIITGLV
ncbi:MAG: pectate lyase [Oscillospiraceae bacterium]|nr:pectate lyase [Oscillospiraceae bacterium]